MLRAVLRAYRLSSLTPETNTNTSTLCHHRISW